MTRNGLVRVQLISRSGPGRLVCDGDIPMKILRVEQHKKGATPTEFGMMRRRTRVLKFVQVVLE